MNKTMKTLLLLTVTLLTGLVLVACGGTKDTTLATAAGKITHEAVLATGNTKDTVTKDLTLPTEDGEVTIVWTSSAGYIKETGKVSRPEEDEANAIVVLTAKLTYKEDTEVVKLTFTVLKQDSEEAPEEVADEGTLVGRHEAGITTKFAEDEDANNAALLGLDPNLVTVAGNILRPEGATYTNPIGLNKDNSIRLYASRDDGEGNVLTITIAEGYEITGIEIVFTADTYSEEKHATTAQLKLDDALEELVAPQITTGTLSKTGLAITSFSLKNTHQHATISAQLWISSISITYKKVA